MNGLVRLISVKESVPQDGRKCCGVNRGMESFAGQEQKLIVVNIVSLNIFEIQYVTKMKKL